MPGYRNTAADMYNASLLGLHYDASRSPEEQQDVLAAIDLAHQGRFNQGGGLAQLASGEVVSTPDVADDAERVWNAAASRGGYAGSSRGTDGSPPVMYYNTGPSDWMGVTSQFNERPAGWGPTGWNQQLATPYEPPDPEPAPAGPGSIDADGPGPGVQQGMGFGLPPGAPAPPRPSNPDVGGYIGAPPQGVPPGPAAPSSSVSPGGNMMGSVIDAAIGAAGPGATTPPSSSVSPGGNVLGNVIGAAIGAAGPGATQPPSLIGGIPGGGLLHDGLENPNLGNIPDWFATIPRQPMGYGTEQPQDPGMMAHNLQVQMGNGGLAGLARSGLDDTPYGGSLTRAPSRHYPGRRTATAPQGGYAPESGRPEIDRRRRGGVQGLMGIG